MIQKLFYTLSVSVIGTGAFMSLAQAQIPSCASAPSPQPGNKCVQRVSVESRHVGYGEGVSRGEGSSTSLDGWFITGWEGPISTNSNNGSANIEFIQRQSNFQINSTLDEYDKTLIKLRDQVQSYANFPIAGVPVTVGGLTEKINESQQENSRRRTYASQAKTNVDRIVVRSEAQGRCTKNVLGTCVDNAGGWYRGYVDVYMVYVGSQSSITASQQQIVNEIQQGLQLLEQGMSSSLSGINDLGYNHLPRGLVDVSGDGRADYCRFVGDSPNIFIACAIRTSNGGWEGEYNYKSVEGIDQGYGHLPRGFKDANGDGRADYCRFVGDNPNIIQSCNLATPSGFDPNQYTLTIQ